MALLVLTKYRGALFRLVVLISFTDEGWKTLVWSLKLVFVRLILLKLRYIKRRLLWFLRWLFLNLIECLKFLSHLRLLIILNRIHKNFRLKLINFQSVAQFLHGFIDVSGFWWIYLWLFLVLLSCSHSNWGNLHNIFLDFFLFFWGFIRYGSNAGFR